MHLYSKSKKFTLAFHDVQTQSSSLTIAEHFLAPLEWLLLCVSWGKVSNIINNQQFLYVLCAELVTQCVKGEWAAVKRSDSAARGYGNREQPWPVTRWLRTYPSPWRLNLQGTPKLALYLDYVQEAFISAQGPTQPPTQLIPETSFLRIKRLEC